jgi:hypothetical protein
MDLEHFNPQQTDDDLEAGVSCPQRVIFAARVGHTRPPVLGDAG